MLRKFFAWLLNWELVALSDYDGEVCVRRVIEIGSKRVAWRYGMGVRQVQLLPGGAILPNCYVKSWETVRHKIREEKQANAQRAQP